MGGGRRWGWRVEGRGWWVGWSGEGVVGGDEEGGGVGGGAEKDEQISWDVHCRGGGERPTSSGAG